MKNERNYSVSETLVTTSLSQDEAEKTSELLDRIDHLFVILPLYPSGHMRSDEILENFREVLSETAGSRGTLYIDIEQNEMQVQMKDVDLSLPSARKLHAFLGCLQIVQLEIDDKVTTDELYNLATSLLKARHEVNHTQTLKQVEIGDMPDSIRVVQRELGRRCGRSLEDALKSGKLIKTLRRALRSLDMKKMAPERAAECRSILENVFGKVAEKYNENADIMLAADTNNARSLEQVLEIGLHAIQAAIAKREEGDGGFTNLNQMFELVEHTVLLSEDRDSAEMIVDVLREVIAEEENETQRAPFDYTDGDCERSLEDLCDDLESWITKAGPDVFLPYDNPAARLSVVTQLLLNDAESTNWANVEETLADCVSGSIGKQERSAFAGALKSLLTNGDEELVDHSFPPIMKTIRKTSPRSIAAILTETCEGLNADALKMIWPHCVIEALLGLEGNPAQLLRFYERISRLDKSTMAAALPRLERMAVLEQGEFSSTIFKTPSSALYPVYAQLIRSNQGHRIGSYLLPGLQAAPPNKLGSAILPMINKYNNSYGEFMANLLESGRSTPRAGNLLNQAVEIITKLLPELPKEHRRKPWVIDSIATLGRSKNGASESVLKKIIKSHRFVFFHDWPRVCRRAAKQAMNKSNPDSGRSEVQTED